MRKKPDRVWLILFVGVALITLAGIARLNVAQDRIPWRDNFAMASKESALTHKPIFLYFTADYCEPCEALKTSTWSDKQVASALSAFVPVKIDINAHPDLYARYGANGTPAFVTLTPEGHAIKNTEGYLDPPAFLDWLKS